MIYKLYRQEGHQGEFCLNGDDMIVAVDKLIDRGIEKGCWEH